MYECFVCVHTNALCACLVLTEVQNRGRSLLELELRTAVSRHVALLLHICVQLLTHMHGHTCMEDSCTCIGTHAWREARHGCWTFPSIVHFPSALRQAFSLSLNLTVQILWTASDAPGSTSPCSLNTAVIGWLTLLCGCW